MSLKNVMDAIKKEREVALFKSSLIPDPRARRAKEDQVRRAKENLKELEEKYRLEVVKNAVFIVTKGSKADQFAELASTEFSCFKVAAEEFYEELVKDIDPRYYKGVQSNSTVFDVIAGSFAELCEKIGIASAPMVPFENKFARRLNKKEDLVKLMMEAYNEKVGAELAGIYASAKVSEQMLVQDYDASTVPIVLYTKDKALSEDLEKSLKRLTKNVFKVNTTKESTNESVEKALVDIKKEIKG